jgi:hypothetical protein
MCTQGTQKQTYRVRGRDTDTNTGRYKERLLLLKLLHAFLGWQWKAKCKIIKHIHVLSRQRKVRIKHIHVLSRQRKVSGRVDLQTRLVGWQCMKAFGRSYRSGILSTTGDINGRGNPLPMSIPGDSLKNQCLIYGPYDFTIYLKLSYQYIVGII